MNREDVKKERRRASRRAWAQRNREKKLLAGRVWREKNREKSRAYARVHNRDPRRIVAVREWRRKNRERRAAQHAVRYYKDLEASRARNRAEYAAHRLGRLKPRRCLVCGVDLRGSGNQKWCLECRLIGQRITQRGFYARKGKYTYKRGSDWEIQKYRALARDGNRCRCCRSTERVCVHHIVEWEITKDNSLANLVSLCRGCHIKGHRTKVFQFK